MYKKQAENYLATDNDLDTENSPAEYAGSIFASQISKEEVTL